MNFTFRGKQITGCLVVLPKNERRFEDDARNFDAPLARSMKLKDVMGFDKHRVVDGPVCVSDLAVAGLEHLFSTNQLGRDDFDAMVVVTQSPDYFMPPTSNVIQGRLGLKKDLLCLDINQGCAGFVVGLIQGFLLLSQPTVKRVILINADVLSRKVSPRDRNSYPIVGDAASITVLENSPDDNEIFANLEMDGSGCEVLMIPAGGFRMPSTAETAITRDVGDSNYRALDNMQMDGVAVFNFVQREVPPMITRLLDFANQTKENVDYFLFHQPNRFMLRKLADAIGVPYEKLPNNVVENFGNSSGVTVPTVMAFNLGESLQSRSFNVCFAGFGVGLTTCSMLLPVGPMSFCSMINV